MKRTAAGRAVSEQHRPAPILGHQTDLLLDLDTANDLQLFPSHPWTVRAVWQLLAPLILPNWPVEAADQVTVYEPCAGLGHMVVPLRELFHDVRPSDVFDWGRGYPVADALNLSATAPGLKICFTNPPFDKPLKGMAERIVRRAQISCDHVIVLARLSFLSSVGRHKLHYENPLGNLRHVLPLSERAPMQLGLYNPKCSKPQEYAYFHYQRGYTGPLITIPIAPGARAKHTRPEDVKI